MANTIAHLMVANKIITALPNLIADSNAFYLGSIAPDTISSKSNCTRNDKKIVHLRDGIRDAEWLYDDKMQLFNARIGNFVSKHINTSEFISGQRDFAVGYLVHLLTDKWNHKTIRQQMLKLAISNGIEENDRAFYHMMVNDLEALDYYLLIQYPYISEVFSSIADSTTLYSLPGYIEKEYLAASMNWWKRTYLPNIKERKLMYISPNDIDDFICHSANGITKELEQLILYKKPDILV